MYNDVITLLTITQAVNDNGSIVDTVIRKDVYARYNSIGMKESYTAFAVGLKPEISFTLADYYDYDNQEAIEYEGKRYTVLRTYRKDSNELELVVTTYAGA